MFEFLIGFGIGYFLKGLLSQPRQFDMLLSWDSSSLGWRSVPPNSKIDTGKRYVAAIEIVPDDPDSDYNESR